ncbi:MAG: deoxyribonuclease IV [Thermoguttaceae bacterium]|nr:deoxyribonuclease IV [Thermoguttaceae bacterium]
MNTRIIGCHLSVAKGFAALGKDAEQIGATTFQFHSRNPRGGAVKKRTDADIAAYVQLVEQGGCEAARVNGQGYSTEKLGFGAAHIQSGTDLVGCVSPVAHAPYTLNPASADEAVHQFALKAFQEDWANLRRLPKCLYNFHPGCHVGQGAEDGIKRIIETLNLVLNEESEQELQERQDNLILLETMSGKGSEIGWRFEEIRQIIDGVERSELMGVCLDTCHIYSAGYDLVSDPEGVVKEFDAVIGLNRLKAIHLNDSMHPLGSRKDRHACIGQGTIGYEALRRFVDLPELADIPLILETPSDLDGWANEIRMFRS